MKQREITVNRPASHAGKRLWDEYEVSAYETGVPGLVVHKDPLNTKQWVLTHEKTGLPIHDGYKFKTRRALLEVAEQLSDIDWDVSYDDFDRSQSAYDRICKVHREAYEKQEGI